MKDTYKVKLNQGDFDLFRFECKQWVESLGLKSWSIFYEFKKIEDSFGTMRADFYDRIAVITLSSEWETDFPMNCDIIEKQIKRTAIHEVLELLLCPIETVCGIIDRSEYDSQIHQIIRYLENFLIKNL